MSLFRRSPKPASTAPASAARTSWPDPVDNALLPTDPSTGEPLAPRQQPGFYPGFSTMSQQKFWDFTTRDLVVRRLEDPPPIRFFSPDQARFWRLVHAHLVPQTDRTADRQIDTLAPLDERLYQDRTDGYRYESMPQDREVYTSIGIDVLNAESQARFGGDLLYLPFQQADEVLKAIHDGKPESAHTSAGRDLWRKLDVHRFWQLILQDSIEGYYAHPWAWDEIGFGGPAYPRAYTRLERGEPEPWEVEETRYEWAPPRSSVSGELEPIDNDDQHQSHEGSGGTH